jgi:tetratricopeptide (TPR) repeat protein
MRAGNAGQPAVGARRVRAGLAALGWQEDGDGVPEQHHALVARLVITLAYLESEQGRADYGLRLLDYAERRVAPAERGILLSQRGLMLLRTGRWADALGELIAAEPLVGHDPELLARVLLNRGVLHLNTGDVRLARNDLRRAAAIAETAGLALMSAKATHNLGYCDLLGGDIPGALHWFDAAARTYQRTAPGMLCVLETDRARALLAAGLAEDAAAALDSAIAAFRRQRLDQNRAEAELNRAQAAQLAGDLAAARRWAGLALRRFSARGNHAWAALAELTRLRVSLDAALGAAGSASPGSPRLGAVGVGGAGGAAGAGDRSGRGGPAGAGGRGYGRIAAEAERLAGRLRAYGLPRDAALAELLAARAFAALHRPHDAARCLAAAGPRGLPLEAVLLRRLAQAELAVGAGQTGTALAELRAGLATLHARRGQLGSLDLQTGTAALGAELAGAGLRLLLDGGSARQIFPWLERSRAQAFLVRPVRPPADPEAAAVLAELRQLTFLIRAAELGGAPPDPVYAARRAELRRQVRERSWRAEGLGQTAPVADAGAIAAALSASGQALASIATRDGRLLGVTIAAGQFRLTSLGDVGTAVEAARRLTADLDALAGRRLPPRLEAVIKESVRHQVSVLDTEVVAPLLRVLDQAGEQGQAGVVIVPVGALAGVPWGMLPRLRGRPVTVCPSASAWLAAWQAVGGFAPAVLSAGAAGASRLAASALAGPGDIAPADPGGGPPAPVFVAGPGLRYAVPEVTEIAPLYPGCESLVAEAATVDATLRALDGAPLAHLAAHGYHDRDNVLFSRLDLADGPLMAYDIQRLSVPPRQVVLSACDVGRTVVRPGDEILGFTAALLHMGTPTVISSVSRVADDTAPGVMTAYHRALLAGARPAVALALAADSGGADDEPLTPFVCFGAG